MPIKIIFKNNGHRLNKLVMICNRTHGFLGKSNFTVALIYIGYFGFLVGTWEKVLFPRKPFVNASRVNWRPKRDTCDDNAGHDELAHLTSFLESQKLFFLGLEFAVCDKPLLLERRQLFEMLHGRNCHPIR